VEFFQGNKAEVPVFLLVGSEKGFSQLSLNDYMGAEELVV
jgi:hypothetical protein